MNTTQTILRPVYPTVKLGNSASQGQNPFIPRHQWFIQGASWGRFILENVPCIHKEVCLVVLCAVKTWLFIPPSSCHIYCCGSLPLLLSLMPCILRTTHYIFLIGVVHISYIINETLFNFINIEITITLLHFNPTRKIRT